MIQIAALFVLDRGPYYGIPGVEPWGLPDRDARLYPGPHRTVAHPPCARWGRFWHGSPSKPHQFKLGDDGGCFASALASVRTWGGVLEHPRDSRAWRAFGLLHPPRSGGWVAAGDGIGWTCCVEQGHFGHQARKPTWLYAVDCELPSLPWGASEVPAREGDSARRGILERMSHRQREETPAAFREMLVEMARSAQR